jgi:hemerythrin
MDLQHRALLELVALIRKAFSETDPLKEYQVACEALKGMSDYADVHFVEEEKLMRTGNYPGLDAHVAMHRAFTQRVKEIEDTLASGEGVVSLDDFCGFLENWWITHIVEVDSRYRPYVAEGA